MKSKDGEFVTPTTGGAKAAAAGAAGSLPAADGDWSDVSIVDAPGAGAYPISSFAYLMVHNSLSAYDGKVTADQLNAFRNWAWFGLHGGQSYAAPLGYAELPANVVAIGENALTGMTV